MNIKDFYKKINNLNKYTKYISSSNKKTISSKPKNNDNNNNIINQKNNVSIHNNKRSINKYLSSDSNRKKSSKIRHLSDLEISSNNHNYNNYIQKHINLNIKSETVSTKKHNNIKYNKEKEKESIFISHKNKTKSEDRENNILKKIKLEKRTKNYSPFKPQSSRIKKVKNKIASNIPFRNRNHDEEKISKTFFSNNIINQSLSLMKEKTPNRSNIYNNTEINSLIQKNPQNSTNNGIKNMKFLYNNNNLNTKDIIYHKKFINLNKRKNNSVENENRKKGYNLEIPNINNGISNLHNYSLITLYSNQIKNNKNLDKFKNKALNNLSSINNSQFSTKSNKDKINRKYYHSQEKVQKFYKINNNLNFGFLKKNNNNYLRLNKIKKIDDINSNIINNEQYYFNKINNIPSLICCKSSVNKIKEVVKKVFSNKLYSLNNKNNSVINTYYSNSSAVLRCKLVNKLCNVYFELHINLYKDYQKYVLIKPKLLKGNKLFFMKLFEKIKNELIS